MSPGKTVGLYFRYGISEEAASLVGDFPSRMQLRSAVAKALEGSRLDRMQEGPPCAAERVEISLFLASDREMAQLNGEFRGRAQPTNCLSFPAPVFPDASSRRTVLGDIAIAPAVVAAEAIAQGKRLLDHYRHLLIHSTLHLLGYDHEEHGEALEMEALEIRLLAEMGVADPYEIPQDERRSK